MSAAAPFFERSSVSLPVYLHGDVLETTRPDGRTAWVRVGQRHPDDRGVYVQDNDRAGFLLNGDGRFIPEGTLQLRYRLIYRAGDTA